MCVRTYFGRGLYILRAALRHGPVLSRLALLALLRRARQSFAKICPWQRSLALVSKETRPILTTLLPVPCDVLSRQPTARLHAATSSLGARDHVFGSLRPHRAIVPKSNKRLERSAPLLVAKIQ